MRRITTPTHIFTLPEAVKVEELDEIILTYAQNNKIVLEKRKPDLKISIEDNTLQYTLTQFETSKFEDGKAMVQVRAKKGLKVLASQILYFDVKPVLNQEEL